MRSHEVLQKLSLDNVLSDQYILKFAGWPLEYYQEHYDIYLDNAQEVVKHFINQHENKKFISPHDASYISSLRNLSSSLNDYATKLDSFISTYRNELTEYNFLTKMQRLLDLINNIKSRAENHSSRVGGGKRHRIYDVEIALDSLMSSASHIFSEPTITMMVNKLYGPYEGNKIKITNPTLINLVDVLTKNGDKYINDLHSVKNTISNYVLDAQESRHRKIDIKDVGNEINNNIKELYRINITNNIELKKAIKNVSDSLNKKNNDLLQRASAESSNMPISTGILDYGSIQTILSFIKHLYFRKSAAEPVLKKRIKFFEDALQQTLSEGPTSIRKSVFGKNNPITTFSFSGKITKKQIEKDTKAFLDERKFSNKEQKRKLYINIGLKRSNPKLYKILKKYLESKFIGSENLIISNYDLIGGENDHLAIIPNFAADKLLLPAQKISNISNIGYEREGQDKDFDTSYNNNSKEEELAFLGKYKRSIPTNIEGMDMLATNLHTGRIESVKIFLSNFHETVGHSLYFLLEQQFETKLRPIIHRIINKIQSIAREKGQLEGHTFEEDRAKLDNVLYTFIGKQPPTHVTIFQRQHIPLNLKTNSEMNYKRLSKRAVFNNAKEIQQKFPSRHLSTREKRNKETLIFSQFLIEDNNFLSFRQKADSINKTAIGLKDFVSHFNRGLAMMVNLDVFSDLERGVKNTILKDLRSKQARTHALVKNVMKSLKDFDIQSKPEADRPKYENNMEKIRKILDLVNLRMMLLERQVAVMISKISGARKMAKAQSTTVDSITPAMRSVMTDAWSGMKGMLPGKKEKQSHTKDLDNIKYAQEPESIKPYEAEFDNIIKSVREGHANLKALYNKHKSKIDEYSASIDDTTRMAAGIVRSIIGNPTDVAKLGSLTDVYNLTLFGALNGAAVNLEQMKILFLEAANSLETGNPPNDQVVADTEEASKAGAIQELGEQSEGAEPTKIQSYTGWPENLKQLTDIYNVITNIKDNIATDLAEDLSLFIMALEKIEAKTDKDKEDFEDIIKTWNRKKKEWTRELGQLGEKDMENFGPMATRYQKIIKEMKFNLEAPNGNE